MAKLLLYLTLCVTSCVAQQLARATCDSTRRTADVEMTSANVVLGGLFGIREAGTDGYGCGQPSRELMQAYEAARWVISDLNRRNFMNGIRMGMRAYDTCFSAEQSLASAYNFYPQSSSRASYCTSSPTQINLGFLGPSTSGSAISVAGLVKHFPAPVISTRAASSALSNKLLYPTFMRTTPSTVVFARAIIALLERLQWNQIVMVYTEGAYARDGLDQILKFAQNTGKCIIHAIPIKSGENQAQILARLSVLQRYDVNGAIMWSPNVETHAFLGAMQTLIQSQPAIGRIQWIFSNLDVTRTYTERQARGGLLIRPTTNIIEEFKNHWINLQETNPPSENPWFMDWYMSTYDCRLPGVNYEPYASKATCPNRDVTTKSNEYIQSPFVESTIRAIYAYAVAVRDAQLSLCPGQFGFCNAVRTMDATVFQNFLKTVRYTFTASDNMASLVGKTLAFDSNGDMETSSMTVWNYVNNRFQAVGTYENNNLTLDVASITFYGNQRLTQIPAPTSLCPDGGCKNCLLPDTDYSYTYIPGDILIGGLLGLRGTGADPLSCGAYSDFGTEEMMALKYALSNYRRDLGRVVLPGVDVGALVLDTCSNKYITSAFLNDLLTNRKTFKDSSGGNIDTEYLRSFVDIRGSANALESSHILGQYKMPEIEVAATSDHLGDRMMYPYFNRAIPPNDVMISAMINILKRLGWSYAQIVYSEGSYGHESMMSFKRQAAKAQICIAGAYSFSLGASTVVDRLRDNSQAKAVIVFGYMSVIRDLFKEVKAKTATGEFIFIGNDVWADSAEIVDGFTDVADGSLTIKQASPSQHNALFNQYLATFNTLSAIRAEPVLSQLFEQRFKCYLNSGNRGSFTRPCTYQAIVATSNYSPFAIHAVYSMVQALHNTLLQICGSNYNGLCTAFRDRDAVSSTLLQNIRNISYSNTQSGQTFSLLNGEGTADFEILNYQNGRGYVNVGRFTTESRSINNMQTTNIRLPNGAALSSVTSKCTQKCLECFMYQQQPFLYVPGDILLGGMFSVSSPGNQGPFICGSVETTNGFQYTVAMQYAIEMVNSKQAPVSLNGIRLGGIALDHCNNQDRPFSLLSGIYSGLMDRSMQMMGMTPSMYKNTLARKIAAWLTDTSASTEEAGAFLQSYSIPIVSPSATSTSLMNISSFYRTIQGDDTVAMAMVKTVKSLSFPYVQVVHSANSYGRGGLSAVKAAGQQEGICVISSTEFDSSMTAESIIQKLINSPTDVVILYLETSEITSLLRAKAASLDPVAAKLVFISPDPYTQVVRTVGGTDATNMLSIRLKTPTLTSFTAYLNDKTSSRYMENPFFARYYMAVFNCNLPGYYTYSSTCNSPLTPLPNAGGNFALSNYIGSTINAVYSATFTLDATLKQLCGENYDGVCKEFSNAADLNIRLVENLRQATFSNMGNNFRFLNREGNSGYDILRFDGSNYQTVGSYEGAALQLNTELTQLYRNIDSTCTPPCLECIQTGLNFSYVPGDILLGGLFDVHEKSLNPFSCGKINTLHGFQLLEAFHYALGVVNSKEGMFTNILRGTTLGGVGLDSCESAIRTGYLVSNIHNGLTSLAKNGFVIDPESIDMYIGGYSSDRSIYLARILSDLEMPQISYAASSTALLDHFRYPYFYRTVPADDKQAKAMITFLDTNDIRYVQVLYTQTNYGEFGAAAFERLASEKRICVGQMVQFPDNGTASKESSNDVITQLLAKPVANTIVVFAGTSYINALLRAVKRNPAAIGKFRFLGSETWANNEDAILEVEEIARGSVTFNLKTANLKVYDDYLSGKTPANSQDNPWFGEYYEEIQNCYLTLSDGAYSKQCPQTPKNIISSIRYKQDPGVLHVINSVYSAAFAIDFTLKELCGVNYTTVCEAYKNRPDTRDVILRNLQRVTFADPSGENFKFTDRREGNKGYDIYNLKFIPVEGYVYRKIGTVGSDGVIASDFTPDYDGSCIRPDACAECPTIRNVGVRYAIDGPVNADPDALTVVGIFDIHEQGTDPYRCGKIRDDGLKQFLAFFYTMQRVVSKDFNRNLRTVVIDTCSNSLRTGQDIYNLINGRGLCNSKFDYPGLIKLQNIVGFVVAGNENTLGASRVLDPFKVSYISPSASSIIFNNTEVFQYLARTTGPKGHMLKRIAEIMNAMDWDYVVAVSSSWRFDDGGYNHFLSVSGEKTCIRSSSNLPVNPSFDDAKEALQQLMTAVGSNVIILFTTKEDSLLMLRAAKELNVLDKFFWVFTDPEADQWEIPNGYYFKGLILRVRQGNVRGYLEYAGNTTFKANLDNLNDRSIPKSWYEEYYQHHFRCRLNDAEFPVTEYTKMCNKNETFTSVNQATMDRYTLSTIAAAYALVKGLSDHCGSLSTEDCHAKISSNRGQLFSNILNITAVPLSSKVDIPITKEGEFNLKFNSERYWDAGYIAMLWEHDSRTSVPVNNLSELAYWKGDALTGISRNKLTDFTSTCPQDASCGCAKPDTGTAQPQQQGPDYTEPRNYYLYGNDGTKIHEWPVWAIAVAVLTCLGLIVAILATLILLFTYPIRGGTTILGFVVLMGIIGIYAINFAFFLPASFAICATRRFCMGVIYMIVFSALLVKAVDNWRYGDMEWVDQKKYHRITSACALFMIAIGVILIQAIIPIEWLILVPPTASKMVDSNLHDYWWCDPVEMYDIGLVLSFIFVMFIVLVTSIFAAMSWDSEVNNRESRWILIGSICTAGCFLVWMIVTTNAGPTYRDPAVAIANFVNATALLICIPLRKMALLVAYKRAERLEEEPGVYDQIPFQANGYPNNAYDQDFDFQRQDSKQDSEVAF